MRSISSRKATNSSLIIPRWVVSMVPLAAWMDSSRIRMSMVWVSLRAPSAVCAMEMPS